MMNLLLFLLPTLVPLVVFLLIVMGVTAAIVSSVGPEKKRTAKRLGWGIGGSVSVVISALYLAFIWLLVDAHLDKPNLIGPTPEDKLAEWTQACDERMREGTSLQEVETYVRSLGFFDAESEETWRQQSFYRHFRKESWVQYQVVDKDVLNWGLGEIDIETTIDLHDDVVSSCRPRIFEHGR